jgi:hypothetical protein
MYTVLSITAYIFIFKSSKVKFDQLLEKPINNYSVIISNNINFIIHVNNLFYKLGLTFYAV